MITSPQNEKLKLVRKLAERKHREREALFATEGEDLLAAGPRRRPRPAFRAGGAPGSGIEGEEVEADLLDGVSTLGSGTRAIAVWRQAWAEPGPGPLRLPARGRRPGERRRRRSARSTPWPGARRARPGLRRPALAEGRARQHGLDLRGGPCRGPPSARRPRPRAALVAHGGGRARAGAPATLCLGLRARRAARGRGRRVRRALDDPAAGRVAPSR